MSRLILFIALGDIIGYYDEPNEVVDFVRKKGILSVKGNHEKYLLEELNYNSSRAEIYGIDRHLKKLTKNNMFYLKNLPETIHANIDNKKILIAHSLPGDQESYIHNGDIIDRDILNACDYYFYAHTHIPSIKFHYGCCLINPGSVGQPRDYLKKPSCVIVDLENDEVCLKRIDVNARQYASGLKKKYYNDSLIDILLRGK